jgi:Type VI secretion system/phage-baseplate injector OB domain
MKMKHLVRCCFGCLVGLMLLSGVAEAQAPFWGKYRGAVVNIADPLGLGRVQAVVPDVLGTETSQWALPALPFAGLAHGLFLLPEIGDQVWIEFEKGDPNSPIWTGVSLTPTDVPAFPLETTRALVTRQGHRILIDEVANRIELHHPGGAEVTLSQDEITLKIGATSLSLSPQGIFMNGKLVSKTK